jgi:hypothetical protein
MSTPRLTTEQMNELRMLALRWGEVVARRTFGPEGPGQDVDLATMEKIATTVARGLTEGTLTALLDQQVRKLPSEVACPECGRVCAVTREPRPLEGKSASITYSEAVAHYPDCHRDFFPPADRLADQRA